MGYGIFSYMYCVICTLYRIALEMQISLKIVIISTGLAAEKHVMHLYDYYIMFFVISYLYTCERVYNTNSLTQKY